MSLSAFTEPIADSSYLIAMINSIKASNTDYFISKNDGKREAAFSFVSFLQPSIYAVVSATSFVKSSQGNHSRKYARDASVKVKTALASSNSTVRKDNSGLIVICNVIHLFIILRHHA